MRAGREHDGRALLAFTAAAAALAGAVALLLHGAAAGPAAGFCPERSSVPAYAGERRLLVRTGPPGGGAVFLRLCTDRAAGPVRSWTVRAGNVGIPVLPVADGVAVAAVPVTAGRPTDVTVVVTPRAGRPLTFSARV